MSRFIMIRRRMNGETTPTWINVENINTIAATVTGPGSRITMRDGFLVAEEEPGVVLERIRRAEDDR